MPLEWNYQKAYWKLWISYGFSDKFLGSFYVDDFSGGENSANSSNLDS